MPKDASYELLIDGELIEPLLAMWSVRLDKMDRWVHRTNRTTPLYDQLLDVYKTSQRAHTDLTTLHIYQKRNPIESEKVQQQLRIASVSHQKAKSLYSQLLNDMSD